MDKRKVKLGIVITIVLVLVCLLFSVLKNVKIDEFYPALITFVIDSSASNQTKLEEQKKYLKQICNRLDPEDKIKIVRVSEDAYLIYEGTPHNISGITKSLNSFTKYDSKDYGTAYGEGLKKAFSYTSNAGDKYIPAIVVIGDLENEGNLAKQINWNTLPDDVKKIKSQKDNLVMMFVYAHPQKLDLVKTKLGSILGEDKLIISPEENADKALKSFIYALGR